MRLPHPIPYQGSKRIIASQLLSFFPPDSSRLVEPFAGSAAVSIAAAYHGKASRFHLNDLNEPLMRLWKEIIDNPMQIAAAYTQLWGKQQGQERTFYNEVRDDFNRTKKSEHLLYLLARCVKASVRYNEYGQFNQSPDNRRQGRNPRSMKADIFAVSSLLRSKVTITSQDYRDVLGGLHRDDLVYMDPPYQGVCGNRDQRYSDSVAVDEFIRALKKLTREGVCFILSYDGRCGEKVYGERMPSELNLYRIEIEVGRSTQATLLGRKDITYESIYLSPSLADRLEIKLKKDGHVPVIRRARQLVMSY